MRPINHGHHILLLAVPPPPQLISSISQGSQLHLLLSLIPSSNQEIPPILEQSSILPYVSCFSLPPHCLASCRSMTHLLFLSACSLPVSFLLCHSTVEKAHSTCPEQRWGRGGGLVKKIIFPFLHPEWHQ